jgi:S-adenosyl-L-methionine hydrolase (adenosine-forming)
MTQAASGIVTLLTDFGADDPYVGIMKGVVLSLHRGATLIDLCHGVPPQHVELGALWLAHGFGWFPAGTVHLAVVDPGVGSARAALAARAGGHFFVGPDNGLLSRVASETEDFEARRLDAAALGFPTPSRTFHGRDVFARVAALLAADARCFDALGPTHTPARLALSPPFDDGRSARGRVLAVDRFGNLITDLPGSWLERPHARVELDGKRFRPVGTYAEAGEGESIALTSSFGLVELAVRNGSAAASLGLGPGAVVLLLSEGTGR